MENGAGEALLEEFTDILLRPSFFRRFLTSSRRALIAALRRATAMGGGMTNVEEGVIASFSRRQERFQI
jgi:hypothetical protein